MSALPTVSPSVTFSQQEKTKPGVLVAYSNILGDTNQFRVSLSSVADSADCILILGGDANALEPDPNERVISEVASRFDPAKTGTDCSVKTQFYNIKPDTSDTDRRNTVFQLLRPNNFVVLMEPNEELVDDVERGFARVREHPEKRIFWVQNQANGLWYPKIIRTEIGLHYPVHDKHVKNTYKILDSQGREYTTPENWQKLPPDQEAIFEFSFRNVI
jgi:hypothetical protein